MTVLVDDTSPRRKLANEWPQEPNDGEFGKPMRAASDRGAWGNYIFDRVSGFGPTSPESIAWRRPVT